MAISKGGQRSARPAWYNNARGAVQVGAVSGNVTVINITCNGGTRCWRRSQCPCMYPPPPPPGGAEIARRRK